MEESEYKTLLKDDTHELQKNMYLYLEQIISLWALLFMIFFLSEN